MSIRKSLESKRQKSLEIIHICHLEAILAQVGGFMSLKQDNICRL